MVNQVVWTLKNPIQEPTHFRFLHTIETSHRSFPTDHTVDVLSSGPKPVRVLKGTYSMIPTSPRPLITSTW